ncbi:MAG: MotA/TolQ/ExbB proton channel family protein [Pseudomonadota bacterium]|nr:MotA/TolQ/ExbB proton channel family protein [Pseudomonadota bacterium]
MPTLPNPESLVETLKAGGPMMILMILVSVLIVALALERWINVMRAGRAVRRLDDRVLEAARKGNLEEARRLCDGVPAPTRDVFTAGLDRALGRVKGHPRMAMQREQKRAVASLKAGIWMLGTSGALMPFVGLLGTVLGVMSSFHAIGSAGTGGFAVVSAGISEALIATAAGLFVALEAIIFFNYLQSAIGGVARDLGLLVDELVEIVETREASDAGSSAG